jgi:hypothetical protein
MKLFENITFCLVHRRHRGNKDGIISRGEVGLIVARVAISAGAITQSVYSAILGMIIITTILAPLLLRRSYDNELHEEEEDHKVVDDRDPQTHDLSSYQEYSAHRNHSQKMVLGITTLLSAAAFHLSLLSGIPPTGYLTLADRMMISVYILFPFNIGSAVYLMKLSRANKKEQATVYNKKAQRMLPIIIAALVIMTILI